MTIKILTLISIWYVFYFLLGCIMRLGKATLPVLRLYWFGRAIDIIGNNVYTFMISFMFLVWNYFLN